MRVVIINKSDSRGGAAVVSRRLMMALRNAGVDARMLVCEKLTDSPFVEIAASETRIKVPFLAERLKIFIANRFNRRDLFKVDSASDGLPLWRHPLVKEADVICLNWVNQGMLSLKGVRRLLKLGKPMVWTMHDMWCMTGICHHAGTCIRWEKECGECPMLGKGASGHDLSHGTYIRKKNIYSEANRMSFDRATKLHFVAVSNWLARLARQSSLMSDCQISVIPNAFPIPEDKHSAPTDAKDKFRIIMGAARLDDSIKGLPTLVEATKILRDKYPEESRDMELVTFGGIKDSSALDGIAIAHRHLGVITGEDNVRKVYAEADVVVSTSYYETLPGTLVEGQVYGAFPVAFDRGGQADIIDHDRTGYLAEWSDDLGQRAGRIAQGIVRARQIAGEETTKKMRETAAARFDAHTIAAQYICLFDELRR